MENFIAIYSTDSHKDINYSFQAENMAKAVEYCKTKFSVPVKIICEDNGRGNSITTQEIFEANQVLTLEIAKTLIGKKIAVTNPEYKYNTPSVRIGKVLGIESDWDLAAKEDMSHSYDGKWNTRQEYWLERLPTEQNEWAKKRLTLVADNQLCCTCDLADKWNFEEPTFFGSDADREIYFIILE